MNLHKDSIFTPQSELGYPADVANTTNSHHNSTVRVATRCRLTKGSTQGMRTGLKNEFANYQGLLLPI